MSIFKYRHSVFTKVVALVFVCLFPVFSMPSAQEELLVRLNQSRNNTLSEDLSPEASLTLEEFKEKYLASITLLTHRAVNDYIGGKFKEGDLRSRPDYVWINDKEKQDIIIYAVPDLLRNTGQFAHVGLGRKNKMPAIYVDEKYFYSEAVVTHDKDEIGKWETKRRSLKLDYAGMRRWIKENIIEAKEDAEEFHASSLKLDELYGEVRKNHKDLLDWHNMYALYLAYRDEEDSDVNIAAKSKDRAKRTARRKRERRREKARYRARERNIAEKNKAEKGTSPELSQKIDVERLEDFLSKDLIEFMEKVRLLSSSVSELVKLRKELLAKAKTIDPRFSKALRAIIAKTIYASKRTSHYKPVKALNERLMSLGFFVTITIQTSRNKTSPALRRRLLLTPYKVQKRNTHTYKKKKFHILEIVNIKGAAGKENTHLFSRTEGMCQPDLDLIYVNNSIIASDVRNIQKCKTGGLYYELQPYAKALIPLEDIARKVIAKDFDHLNTPEQIAQALRLKILIHEAKHFELERNKSYKWKRDYKNIKKNATNEELSSLAATVFSPIPFFNLLRNLQNLYFPTSPATLESISILNSLSEYFDFGIKIDDPPEFLLRSKRISFSQEQLDLVEAYMEKVRVKAKKIFSLLLEKSHSEIKEAAKWAYYKKPKVINPGNIDEGAISIVLDEYGLTAVGEDEKNMVELLQFAKREIAAERLNSVMPVAARIVDKDNNVVVDSIRTIHPRTKHGVGAVHGEIQAIRDAEEKGFSDWGNATIYITCDSCYNCSRALTEFYGFRRVVYGMQDPTLKTGERNIDGYMRNGVTLVECDDESIREEIQNLFEKAFRKEYTAPRHFRRMVSGELALAHEYRKVHKRLFGRDVQVIVFDADLWKEFGSIAFIDQGWEDQPVTEERFMFRHLEWLKQNLNPEKDVVLLVPGESQAAEEARDRIIDLGIFEEKDILITSSAIEDLHEALGNNDPALRKKILNHEALKESTPDSPNPGKNKNTPGILPIALIAAITMATSCATNVDPLPVESLLDARIAHYIKVFNTTKIDRGVTSLVKNLFYHLENDLNPDSAAKVIKALLESPDVPGKIKAEILVTLSWRFQTGPFEKEIVETILPSLGSMIRNGDPNSGSFREAVFMLTYSRGKLRDKIVEELYPKIFSLLKNKEVSYDSKNRLLSLIEWMLKTEGRNAFNKMADGLMPVVESIVNEKDDSNTAVFLNKNQIYDIILLCLEIADDDTRGHIANTVVKILPALKSKIKTKSKNHWNLGSFYSNKAMDLMKEVLARADKKYHPAIIKAVEELLPHLRELPAIQGTSDLHLTKSIFLLLAEAAYCGSEKTLKLLTDTADANNEITKALREISTKLNIDFEIDSFMSEKLDELKIAVTKVLKKMILAGDDSGIQLLHYMIIGPTGNINGRRNICHEVAATLVEVAPNTPKAAATLKTIAEKLQKRGLWWELPIIMGDMFLGGMIEQDVLRQKINEAPSSKKAKTFVDGLAWLAKKDRKWNTEIRDIVFEHLLGKENYTDEAKAVCSSIFWPERFSPSFLREIVKNRIENKPDGRPLAVVVYPHEDWNLAFGATTKDSPIGSLISHGYRVMYYEGTEDEHVYDALKDAAKKQKASVILLGGHGNAGHISFGADDPAREEVWKGKDIRDYEKYMLDLGDEDDLMASKVGSSLEDNGTVMLDSCSTGEGKEAENNMANLMRRIFPQASHIIAPVAPAPSGKVKYDKKNRVIGVEYKEGVEAYDAVKGRAKVSSASSERDLAWLNSLGSLTSLEEVFARGIYTADQIRRVKEILSKQEIDISRSLGDIFWDKEIKPYVKWSLQEILIDEYIKSFYEKGGKNYGKWYHYGEKDGELEELAGVRKFFSEVLGYDAPLAVLGDLMERRKLNVLQTAKGEVIFNAHASPTFGINICSTASRADPYFGGAIVHELMALSGSSNDTLNEIIEKMYLYWRDERAVSGMTEVREEIERVLKANTPLEDEDLPDLFECLITEEERAGYDKPEPFGSVEEMNEVLTPLANQVKRLTGDSEGMFKDLGTSIASSLMDGMDSSELRLESEISEEVFSMRMKGPLKDLKASLESAFKDVAGFHKSIRDAVQSLREKLPVIVATCASSDEALREAAEDYILLIIQHPIERDFFGQKESPEHITLEFQIQGVPISERLKEKLTGAYMYSDIVQKEILRKTEELFEEKIPDSEGKDELVDAISGVLSTPLGKSRNSHRKSYEEFIQREGDLIEKLFKYATIMTERGSLLEKRGMTESAFLSYVRAHKIFRRYLRVMAEFVKFRFEEREDFDLRMVYWAVPELSRKIAAERGKFEALGVEFDEIDELYIRESRVNGKLILFSNELNKLKRVQDENLRKIKIELPREDPQEEELSRAEMLHGEKALGDVIHEVVKDEARQRELDRLERECHFLEQERVRIIDQIGRAILTLSMEERDWASLSTQPEKSSPAELMMIIMDNPELLSKLRNPEEGLTASDLFKYRPFSDSIVHGEFFAYKDAGVFRLCRVQSKTYYCFTDWMIGKNENHTKTMINAINDIRFQIGKTDRADERPFHRGTIHHTKRSLVRELVKMTALDQIDIVQNIHIPEDKVLWHILEHEVVGIGEANSSFTQKVNNAFRESNAPERIWITRGDETIEGAMTRIKRICPNAIFDVALAKGEGEDIDEYITSMPDSYNGEKIKMLVFEGDDFVGGSPAHIRGVIAALRALHLNKEEVVPALLWIYEIINEAPYEGGIPDVSLLDDPKEFARQFVFSLPRIWFFDYNKRVEMQEMLLKMLTSA